MEISEFRQRVYKTLKRVPKGKITTYKDLAAAVGVRSPQAVGQALKHNPFAPIVPCHRVVKNDGTIGGFNGCTEGGEIARKIALLRSEGVLVVNNQVCEFAQCRHGF